jgi:O-antigen/teichoic acid export membrane protein
MSISIRLNLAASAAGQFYSALVGIIMLPVFYSEQWLGPASVGVVGFYTLAMFWFGLLDLGLTPTLHRETTRFLAGKSSADHYFSLIMPMLSFFLVIALLSGWLFVSQAPLIADHWLINNGLQHDLLTEVLRYIGLVLFMRLLSGVLRGLVGGAECILWLNLTNCLLMTIRFVLVLPVMYWFGISLITFFAVQLFAAVVELTLLSYKGLQILKPVYRTWRFSWEPFRQSLTFSMSAALLSLLGVMLTQLDKLLLSGMLPLSEYAEVTLAVSLSSGILLVGTVFGAVLQPRLTALYSHTNMSGWAPLYRSATQWITVLVSSAVMVIVFAYPQVLLAWTGQLINHSLLAQLLPWYAIGCALMVLNGIAYYLQFAAGRLRLHLTSQCIVVLIWALYLYFGLAVWGAVGAAIAWCCIQLVLLLIYVYKVHQSYLPGQHWRWLSQDVLQIVVPVALFNYLFSINIATPSTRFAAIAQVCGLIIGSIAIAVFSSSDLRHRLNLKKRIGVEQD